MKLAKPFIILTLLALLIAPSLKVYSQTRNSNIVSDDQTIAVLIAQVKKDKNLIEKQEQRIKDLEAELSAEQENSASISVSYDKAKSEIESLKIANDALRRAVALNEQTIAMTSADRDKWKDKAKKEKRDKWIVVGAVLVKFIFF